MEDTKVVQKVLIDVTYATKTCPIRKFCIKGECRTILFQYLNGKLPKKHRGYIVKQHMCQSMF